MRTLPSPRFDRSDLGSCARSGGQIVVLFAGSIVLFVLLCGTVVDIAYYWVGSLQAQRAADAAAEIFRRAIVRKSRDRTIR